MDRIENNRPDEDRVLDALISPAQREILVKEGERIWDEFEREESSPATGRNFEAAVQEGAYGPTIVLKNHESGAAVDLQQYLPRKYAFRSSDKFTAAPELGLVRFQANYIASRGFFISLFHELGHAHDDKAHRMPLLKELKAMLQAKLKAPFTPLTEQIMPDWYLDLLEKRKAESERGAWAYALRTLRELEKQGFNVFAGFNNAQEISNYIALCLQTYDISIFLEATDNLLDNRVEIGKTRFAKNRPSPRNIISK